MKKTSAIFFLFLSVLLTAQDCDQIQASFEFRAGKLRHTILNGKNALNEIDIKKNYGSDGSLSSNEFATGVYAHNLWYAGKDPANNLKIAAGTYGGETNKNDWYAGPLNDDGVTSLSVCNYWDKVFSITKDDVMIAAALFDEGNNNCDLIPDAVKYWPARNNPFITDVEFPQDKKFADFWDQDGDGNYNPCNGDLPGVIYAGCGSTRRDWFLSSVPINTAYWIINDAGGPHHASQGSNIKVEVQNYAFNIKRHGLKSAIFYIQRFTNKANESIKDSRVGAWFDFDLGCYTNDLIGISDDKKILFAYNETEDDWSPFCDRSETKFETKPPVIGFSYLQGNIPFLEPGDPDFTGIRDGISSAYIPLTYTDQYNYSSPSSADEYYRNLTGKHIDNSLQLDQNGNETTFSFVGNPNNPNEGSLCSPDAPVINTTGILTTGPELLQPGQTKEVMSVIFMTEDINYPCPDISSLMHQREVALHSYQNCVNQITGPSAPNLDLNFEGNKLNVTLNNDYIGSNNKNQSYKEQDPVAPENDIGKYFFEGYKIYQVDSEDFDMTELDNNEVSKLIYQGDLQNDISDISNWEVKFDGGSEKIYYEENKVIGNNKGIFSSFALATDAFTKQNFEEGKDYYFVAIAYAYNNYAEFNPDTVDVFKGQDERYLEGLCNVKVTKASKLTSSLNEGEVANNYDIKILPNQFEVNSKNEKFHINLYNSNGARVSDWKINSQAKLSSGDLSQVLPSGIYIMQVKFDSTNKSQSYKLVITK